MLDVCLLGTGGMMPLPYRWLTSLITRHNGSNLLIDCGEGTQITLKEQGWGYKQIDIICITHFHADHISGLPGMLLAMANSERTESLLMIGPKGLERVVNALRVIVPQLPFAIEFHEVSGDKEEIIHKGYRIVAFHVNHRVNCYGYAIHIDRQGKFDVERAKALDIPIRAWSLLQRGECVEHEGKVFTPDMVLGEQRKGIHVTYCTDTRPTASIEEAARHSDLFICEGMYAEKLENTNAVAYKHMTFEEAATIAKKAEVKKLWLTHFSPSLIYPKEHLPVAKAIFKNTVIPKDRKTITLLFED
ncbi:MAG: ribonuclease Z [Eubacteriales bacterium]|nr:ribonuclease Z [Eubacteriales bacterium]